MEGDRNYRPSALVKSVVVSSILAMTYCNDTQLYAGDGSDEPGFVPPRENRQKPPAPPRTSSSAETMDACCCCPVTPLSRTEAKRPPKPPLLITKIMEHDSSKVPESNYTNDVRRVP